MRKHIVGVMGPRDPSGANEKKAYEVGRLIAKNGWVTLSGGVNLGVMDAVSRGAKREGGLTIGILPEADASNGSKHLDIPIVTEMGQARNCINVLSSDALIAIGMNPGTASEVALGIRAKKPVVLLGNSVKSVDFFLELDNAVKIADTPEEAVGIVKALFRA